MDRRRRSLLALLPWAVGLLSLAATLGLWRHEQHIATLAVQSAFDGTVRQTAGRIEQRLVAYEQMLRGVQGLMQAGAPIERLAFERYVDALLAGADFAGVQHFAWAPAPPADALPAAWPYVAPASALNAALLAAPPDTALQQALQRSRDAGSLSVSAWRPDAAARPGAGFRLVLPVYESGTAPDGAAARRRALRGWVMAGVQLPDLLSSLYGERIPGVELALHDGVLSPSKAATVADGEGPRLETLEYVGFAGHTWTLAVTARPEFLRQHGGSEAKLIAAAGCGFSALLALVTWLLVGGRERAHATARAMTAELAASEARYRRIVLTADEGIWVCDADGRTSFVNPKMARLLGEDEAALIGRRREEFMLPDVHAAAGAAPGDCRFRRRDGSVMFASCVVTPVLDELGLPQGTLAMVTDVSARREAERARGELEAQLRESQKMEAIGTLAGGIAHDFNNILAAILGNVALLLRSEMGPQEREGLARINTSAVRARSLVQQILAFSRRHPTSLALQPLRPVVEESLSLLRPILPASVRLEARLADAPLPVRVDATQLQQVVMNLCNNAWHALQGQPGQITLELESRTLAPEAAGPLGLAAGGYARLAVVDTGCGMDEATRERVFEPFFTTKPVGQGTGLGLAVVHGIVAAHGGWIGVRSTPGLGSRFEILLPLAAEPLPAPALPAAPPPEATEPRHVAYVDDDLAMVIVVEALLKQAGWRVSGFHEPRAALEALRADPQRFDLLITDYNMPGLSGLDVAAEAARLRPQLPVIVSSGYVTEQMLDETAQVGVRSVIQKEYTLEQLPGLVRRLLAEAEQKAESAVAD